MTFTLSPPVRYAALFGLLAAVLIGGGMTMLGRGESEAARHAINPHPFGKTAKPAATPAATSKSKPKPATSRSKPRPATTPRPTPPAPAKPSAVTAALAAGLPAPLATALGQHRTVVVSLYNPYSRVDAIAYAEAREGARIAGVGFVPLNVLSKAHVQKLTEQLGLLPNPGLLVYVRPAKLAARFNGFADKETVAQAAQNAAGGQ